MNYKALTKEMIDAITLNLKNHMDAPTIEATLRTLDVILAAAKDYADSVVPTGV